MPNLKYTKELLEEAVKNNISYLGVLKSINAPLTSGALRNHIVRRIKFFEIDTSHFLGMRSNSGPRHVGGTGKILVKNILILKKDGMRTRSHMLRRALVESGVKYKCQLCGLKEWYNKKLVLQVDHRNGNPLDNRKENLRFLCPNCHSQRKNFCSPKYRLPQ